MSNVRITMRAEDLMFWVRAAPFAPFRIRLNSGRVFEIRHPEMMRVGRSSAIIFSFSGEPATPYERAEMISLVLIESVEPIESAQHA
jgi:hypothetical protein